MEANKEFVEVVITDPCTSKTVVPAVKQMLETNIPTTIWAASGTDEAVILLSDVANVTDSNMKADSCFAISELLVNLRVSSPV